MGTRNGFDRLVELELDRDMPPSRDPTWLYDAPGDLFGLALSGGGIRSATFNLGLLQGLHARNLLRCFDYVSTVSGGGYIGGFWSAWRHHNAGDPGRLFPSTGRADEGEDGALDPQADGRRRAEPPEIAHLRAFSNFLNPRMALFSFDTGRMAVALVSAVIPSLLAACSLIALVLLAWLAAMRMLMAPPAHAWPLSWIGQEAALSTGFLSLVTLAFLFACEILWRRTEPAREDLRAYTGATILSLTVVFVAWLAWGLPLARSIAAYPQGGILPSYESWRAGFLPLAPCVAWAAASLALVLRRLLVSRWEPRPWTPAYDRVLSRLILLIAANGAIGGILWLAARLEPGEAFGLKTAVGSLAAGGVAGAFAWLQKLLGGQPSKPTTARTLERLKPVAPQLLAYVAVFVIVLLVAMLLLRPFVDLRVKAGAAALVTALTLLFFDPNRVGLHAFYRGRLARAYLGAARASKGGVGAFDERPEDDLPLTDLRGSRPVHLLCCAANALSADEQFLNLRRGAESAVFSPIGFSVGASWREWRPGQPVASLAAAMTTSGAAFNSQMGSWSVRLGAAAVFLMAALNLRLGLWWPHPTARDTRLSSRLPGLRFYLEMLGISRAAGPAVHLSDGGHFDNTGIYELIRRHCRYILASDCGADPDLAFDDFGNLVRRVREDFGVEIQIDLSPLRPGANGLARQPMVAGDIHYPNGDTGVLLLIKPTLVGQEPVDIAQYRRRNPGFPHESTGDQFYDEAQWESYRRLGEHAAQVAFRFVEGEVPEQELEKEKARCARVFTRARFIWMPAPATLVERVDRISARTADLEALLGDPGAARLAQQVYAEAGDAGPEAGQRAADLASPKELVALIRVLRQAVIRMEELYHLAELNTRYNHPLNLGTVNALARWAHAPLFRAAWPLLRCLHSAPFVQFMEDRFGLRAVGSAHREVFRLVEARGDGVRPGFALAAWRRQGGRLGPGDLVWSYRLRLCYEGRVLHRIQAAIVRARRLDDLLVWDSRDFFVPPGLWGVGIGERFLADLIAAVGRRGEAKWLVVRVTPPEGTGPAVRKGTTDLTQLYRIAGFADVLQHAGALVLPDGRGRRLASRSALDTLLGGAAPGARWLARPCAVAWEGVGEGREATTLDAETPLP
ncbi:MAG TPA: hypothetical protein VIL13_07625 [Longimicrobiales bacterium]